MKKFRSSKLSRLTDLGKALTKAGTHLLIEKVESQKSIENIRKLNAARELILSMGELKGAVMKLGQMISVTEDLALPPEIVELFKKLQKDAPTIPYSQMREVFKSEIGDYPENLFKEFNSTPIASASIGQVYKAITKDGQEVAIKVQYPEIDLAIKNDLKNLDQLTKLFKIIFPQVPNLKPLIEELSASILDECNYENELSNIQKFKALYAHHPNIFFQDPMQDYCTQKIITTKFIDGDNFDTIKNYQSEVRDSIGESLYQFHLDQLFGKGFMHTDPQNGNYLFKGEKIFLLDCGSAKVFSEDFIMAYSLLTYSIRNNKKDLFHKALLSLGVITKEDSDELIEHFLETAKSIYLPYTKEGCYAPEKINPIDFVSNLFKRVKTLKNRPTPHQDFVLLDRANIGIFTKLRALEAKIDWLNGIQKYQAPKEEIAIKYFA